MSQQIQLRRGTTAQWADANTVLAEGEPAWDVEAKVFKIGDGLTPWSELPPAGNGSGGGDVDLSGYLRQSDLGFDPDTGLVAENHIPGTIARDSELGVIAARGAALPVAVATVGWSLPNVAVQLTDGSTKTVNSTTDLVAGQRVLILATDGTASLVQRDDGNPSKLVELSIGTPPGLYATTGSVAAPGSAGLLVSVADDATYQLIDLAVPDFVAAFAFAPDDMGLDTAFISGTSFQLPAQVPEGKMVRVTGTSNGKDGLYASTGDSGDTVDLGGGPVPLFGFDFVTNPLQPANSGKLIRVNSDVSGLPHAYLISSPDGVNVSATEFSVGSFASTTDLSDLTTRFEQQYPLTPVKPNHHRSKYVTFDPGAAGSGPENHHLLDGTATHVGGQAIEEGQNLTVANNRNGHGGIWTLHLGDVAERATGLGSVPGEKIGGYDVVYYTGTIWAEETDWRIVTSDPTQYGIDLIDQAWPITRANFRPSLIATTLVGSTFTVLNADGSTSNVDAGDLDDLTSPVCDVLVLDVLILVTVDAGVIVETEDFSDAEGMWTARGTPGARDHAGAVVSTMAGGWTKCSA